MYIAPGQGRKPLGDKCWCQQKALITLPICCRFKKNCFEVWFYIYLFHVSPYVYSPRQGQTIHWGQNFDDNRKAFSLCPYVASFKMISSKSDFMCVFSHVYSPRQGQTTHWEQKFDDNRKAFSLCHMLQVSKWSLRNLILYIFLMILYMYIAPGQGQKTPWGQTFDVNRKPLSLQPFVESFKQISLNSDFLMFSHMYISRGRATLCGQNPDVNRKALLLCPFVASFKKIPVKSDFIHNFSCFYTSI